MDEIPQPPELEPTTSPDMLQIPFSLGVWGWCAIAVGVIVVAVIVWLVIRKPKKVPVPPTPEQIARQKVTQLQASSPGVREGTTELSLILRSYLTGKSQDPALFETHQEFNRRADALSSLPLSVQTPVRDLLHRMASLKYSSEARQDTNMMDSFFAETLDLINKVEQEQLIARREESEITEQIRPTK